ncbi:MAG TPA: hypothetical protein VJA25_01185 [Dehalococcoidia bacterium]|nr:hypothetical protein [Dehalococcoidia bacterium]
MTDEQRPDTVVQPTVAPIVLRNGTLKDPVTNRFISGPTVHPITKANAHEMGARALEARRRKARAELVAAAEQHTGKSGLKPSDAWAVIAGEAARSALANMMDKPRDAVHAAKLSRDMAWGADQQQQQPAADGLAVTGAGISFLRELMQRAAPQVIHVVEGEAHELED